MMSLSSSNPSQCGRSLLVKNSALASLIFFGNNVGSLEASLRDSKSFSLPSPGRTSPNGRKLESSYELEKDVYTVNTNFNILLDYVPGEFKDNEADRLSILLEDCLLDNIPPFQDTSMSTSFQLQDVEVQLGKNTTIEKESMSLRFEQSYRLVVEVSIEGQYGVSEEEYLADSVLDPPTDEDFDYALSRFFNADEGASTFLYSYLTDADAILPYFQDAIEIQVQTKNTGMEEKTALNSDNGSSSSSATLAFVIITGNLLFFVSCYILYRAYTGKSSPNRQEPYPEEEGTGNNRSTRGGFTSVSTDASAYVQEEGTGQDQRIAVDYAGLLIGATSSSHPAESKSEEIPETIVATYDVRTRKSLLQLTESSLARNLGTVAPEEEYKSAVQRKFRPDTTMVAVDDVGEDGKWSTSTIETDHGGDHSSVTII